MSTYKHQQAREQAIRHALNSSVDPLSPNVEKRLQQARLAALDAQPKPWFRFQAPWLGWSLAASLCLAIYLNIGPQQTPELTSNSELDAFILMTSLDETELDIIEDLEFAYWISQQLNAEDTASASHRG